MRIHFYASNGRTKRWLTNDSKSQSKSSSSCVWVQQARRSRGSAATTATATARTRQNTSTLSAHSLRAAAALLRSQSRRRQDLRGGDFSFLPSLPLQLSDVSADSFVSSSLPPLAKLLAASHSRQHVPGQMDMLRIRHRLMTHACLGTMTCFPRESAREGGSEEETCVYASASGFHCRIC